MIQHACRRMGCATVALVLQVAAEAGGADEMGAAAGGAGAAVEMGGAAVEMGGAAGAEARRAACSAR